MRQCRYSRRVRERIRYAAADRIERRKKRGILQKAFCSNNCVCRAVRGGSQGADFITLTQTAVEKDVCYSVLCETVGKILRLAPCAAKHRPSAVVCRQKRGKRIYTVAFARENFRVKLDRVFSECDGTFAAEIREK